jgi:hypothetical protein
MADVKHMLLLSALPMRPMKQKWQPAPSRHNKLDVSSSMRSLQHV